MHFPQGLKRKRCGTCAGCCRSDCGKCIFCQDKPKYGGPGKRKQRCKERKCLEFSSGAKKSEVTTEANLNKNQFPSTSVFLGANRKVHKIIGDGNCFFRAIAYQLLASQEHHLLIRTLIVELMNLNKQMFTVYLMPSPENMEMHLKNMSKQHTWVTQAEVKAAATLFQIPIYYCTTNTERCFCWNVTHPIQNNSIQFPKMNPICKVKHIELLYTENFHYDAIISSTTGQVPMDLPQLSGIEHFIMID